MHVAAPSRPLAASAQPAKPPAAAPTRRIAPASHVSTPILRRLQHVAVATGAAAVLVLSGGVPVAEARSTMLDLASCTSFQQTAAGIEFCDVREGKGEAPQLGDQIVVDFTARVADTGKVYDGSRGFEFTLGEHEVIPGWEAAVLGGEGVPAVKEGGKRTVRIPPQLAYGSDGYSCLYGLSTSCKVPPNSSVIINFEYKGQGY